MSGENELIIKLTKKFGDFADAVYKRQKENAVWKEYWEVWNAVNAASKRLGLPYEEAPAIFDVSKLTPQDFKQEEQCP